jgi:hypothetical protein
LKQHTKYIILLVLLIIVGTWSCERDDICAEATPTTPHLNIRFYDITEPTLLKPVPDFTARALNDAGENLEDIPVASPFDSISLPLRILNEPTTVRFSLEKDTSLRLDEDMTTDSNIDVVTVTYMPEFIYVSRACGYKSIFTNLTIAIEQDGDNWIRASQILTTTIENENQAHIILRH